MCKVCGCSGTEGQQYNHEHDHANAALARKIVRVEREITADNDQIAARNRAFFHDNGIFAANLISAPGSGKTELIVATARRSAGRTPIFVIEGDQQTELDSERVRAAGVPAIQINTGKQCHLDARAVARAAHEFELPAGAALLVENVGNLVCPAGFDLGETARIAVIATTEGDDKPLKYPDAFHHADLMVITKTDLLPYVDFSVEACIEAARRVAPDLEAIALSAKTGDGIDTWLDWMSARLGPNRAAAE